MKRSRLLKGLIISLVAIPHSLWPNRTPQKATKKEITANIPAFVSEKNSIAQLAQPITLTPEGIKKFLRTIYNNQDYGLEFLPNNFSHLTQFLKQGKESHQKRTYVQSVFRLFNNKLKTTSYVNAYAFSNLLEEFPPLLSDYFITIKTSKDILAMQTQVNELLYSRFLSQFKSFKNDPTEFLKTISADIVTSLEQHDVPQLNDPLAIEELRKTTLMFIDTGLSKLIWNPEDQYETWHATKKIAKDLHALFEQHIITDQDDLNDLFRTLIERYCLFLDLTGTHLSKDFFDRVKKDINAQSLTFLTLEEEEDVESKSQRLMRSLTQAQQKTVQKSQKAHA